MATNYDMVVETMKEFPRCHLSIHGVESIDAALDIAKSITDEKASIEVIGTAFTVGVDLGGGGTMTIFVPR